LAAMFALAGSAATAESPLTGEILLSIPIFIANKIN
jgi:hypothetical protein